MKTLTRTPVSSLERTNTEKKMGKKGKEKKRKKRERITTELLATQTRNEKRATFQPGFFGRETLETFFS